MEPNKKQISEEKPETGVTLFVKVGIVVLSIIMIIGFGIKVLPQAISVSSTGSKRDLPIYCVNTEEKKVALTFDTSYGDEDLQKILNILDKYNIKATFFMTGEWVKKYPKDVIKIAAAGHDLGNHSENHKEMTELSEKQCIDEIMTLHYTIKELTGKDMFLFRPPYGSYDSNLMESARKSGYFAIQWDVDSYDWKDYGVDSTIKMVVDNNQLNNGSIVLMHIGANDTPDALEPIIVGLEDKGYEIVPVSKLIYTGKYTVDKTGKQFAK